MIRTFRNHHLAVQQPRPKMMAAVPAQPLKEDAAMRLQVGLAGGEGVQNWVSFRYLVYLNNGALGQRVVKTMDLFDQKTAP